ncbi:MAG: D-alanine--D-alanine ligase [Abyssibacter sp.]|uniref:D-alanine--D-alanine ligase n=1 Tax=Abyssibacter sp. TaxID=2320200 RepID=UPI00321AEB08
MSQPLPTAHSFGRVAVLMGGWSAERAVSLESGRCVLDALQAAGVDAQAVDPTPGDLLTLKARGFDRVFNILHGTPGEDGILQAACALQALPVTGSGLQASANALDKGATKALWRQAGLPVARDVLLREPDSASVDAIVEQLGLPVFVKPAWQGSSVGVARAVDAETLRQAITAAAQHPGPVLVEEAITGGEYTVGVVGETWLPPIRIEASGGFYDYEAKYVSDDTRYLIPCGLDAEAETSMQVLAARAYAVLGCSGWGRVDLMVDAEGQSRLLEVNTTPGMTTHSLVPKAAAALGWSMQTLVLRILATTLEGSA